MNGMVMDVTGYRVSIPIEKDEDDDKKVKVSIETKTGTKYFTMTQAEFDEMLYQMDSHMTSFVKVPGSNLYVNADQIVYLYVREIKTGEEI